MSTRILRLGLVGVAAAVAVVLVVTLWPAGKAAQRASGAALGVSPAPSPSRDATMGKLAYGRNGSIYLANWDGSDPVRIAHGTSFVPANGSYWGEGQIWSPDGRYLAYRGETGKGASYHATVNIRDQQGRLMASFPGGGWRIPWSPDSTRIAAWTRRGGAIGIYGVDGVRQRVLPVRDGLMAPGDFDPVWSPDGASLVVPNGVEIPLNGSAPRHLPATDPRSHWRFWYSPDGSRVAYLAGSQQLEVAAADGSAARVLVRSEVGNVAWSPSGDQIAFDTPTSIGLTQIMGPSAEIGVVDVASGKVTTLIGVGTGRVLGFSPDGNLILFSRTNAKHVSSLWAARTDGSGPFRLVTGTDWGEWQPMR